MTQGRPVRGYASRWLCRSRDIVYKSPSRVQLCPPSFSSLWQLYSLTHTTTRRIYSGWLLGYSRAYVTLLGLFQHFDSVNRLSRFEHQEVGCPRRRVTKTLSTSQERSPVAKLRWWTSDHLYRAETIPYSRRSSHSLSLPEQPDLEAQFQILRDLS